ncbi:MAG: hypothetical protein HWD86_06235 [Kangiellaceae bacterium]|nr:hypothetical protein [Kangiellaceae bacterium]
MFLDSFFIFYFIGMALTAFLIFHFYTKSKNNTKKKLSEESNRIIKYIAGIEAVEIADHLYFYAYSHSDDKVVSPLFKDIGSMAEFASKNLLQRDGEHDYDYWLKLSKLSQEESNLSTERYIVTQNDIKQFNIGLKQVENTGTLNPKLPQNPFFEYILFDLCRENLQVDIFEPLEEHANNISLDLDDINGSEVFELYEYISGNESNYNGINPKSAAAVVKGFISIILSNSQSGWQTTFKSLID